MVRPTAIAVLAALVAVPVAGTMPDVEVLRPAPGEAWEAGGDAVVAWRPRGAMNPDIEEWEAFLSLDGGDYYAYRVTPHLDRDRRHFVFRVPLVASDDVRMLLRFGDEVEEVSVPVPGRMAIRATDRLAVRGDAFPRAVIGHGESAYLDDEDSDSELGEAARKGTRDRRGVIAWVDGTRAGRGLVYKSARPEPGMAPVWVAGVADPSGAMSPRPDPVAPRRARVAVERLGPERAAASPRPAPAARAILCLTCRQNE